MDKRTTVNMLFGKPEGSRSKRRMRERKPSVEALPEKVTLVNLNARGKEIQALR